MTLGILPVIMQGYSFGHSAFSLLKKYWETRTYQQGLVPVRSARVNLKTNQKPANRWICRLFCFSRSHWGHGGL